MLLITNFRFKSQGGRRQTYCIYSTVCHGFSIQPFRWERERERRTHPFWGAGQRGTMAAFYTQLCGCHPSHRTFYRTDMLVQHVSCLLRLHILLGMEKYVWPNFHIICDSVGLITVLDSSCS